MKTIIILDLKEAKAFARKAQGIKNVFTFCPSARDLLEKSGFAVNSSIETYRALSHAKSVVLIEDNLKKLVSYYKTQCNLWSGEAKILEVFIYHLLCDFYYIYFATRHLKNEELYWLAGSEQIESGNYTEMLKALINLTALRLYAYGRVNVSDLHFKILNKANAQIAEALADKIKIIDYGDRLSSRITNAITAQEKNAVMLVPKKAKSAIKTWWYTRKAVKTIKSGGQKTIIFRVPLPQKQCERITYNEEMFPVAGLLKEAILSPIRDYLPFCRAEYKMGHELIKTIKPDFTVSDYSIYPYIYGGAEEMGFQNKPHIMVNHGSHTPQFSPIAKMAALQYGNDERILHPNAEYFLPKSPLALEIAKQLGTNKSFKQKNFSFFPSSPAKSQKSDKFLVLYAGNFCKIGDTYSSHIPVCKETAEEQLTAIKELISECSKLEGVKLVIKLKNKKHDTYSELVRDYITTNNHTHFAEVDTSANFGGLLASCGVLVSNLSITIEEAIFNKVPVMLLTHHKKYFHVTEEYCGNAGKLGPAYPVKNTKDISAIINFLKEQGNKANAPALFANVAWQPEQLGDIKAFAKELLEQHK